MQTGHIYYWYLRDEKVVGRCEILILGRPALVNKSTVFFDRNTAHGKDDNLTNAFTVTINFDYRVSCILPVTTRS